MKNPAIHEKLSEKLKGLLIRIKWVLQRRLRFKTDLHAHIASARHDAAETQLARKKAPKQIKKKESRNQIEVLCTSTVRKRILNNLHAVAVCRANPMRAKIAREMLNELERSGTLANFQPKSHPVRKDNCIKATEPDIKIAETPERTKESIFRMRSNITAVFASIRQRFCLGFGIDKINQPAVS